MTGNCIAQMGKATPKATIGLIFLVLGFVLGLDMIPIFKWTPKIYNMAPHPIAIFISIGINGILILTFLRVIILNLNLFTALPPIRWLIMLLIGASIAWCSVLMLKQANIKSMLAYTSSCHVGYILLGIIANTPSAKTGALFHLMAYLAINIGAFGALSAFGLVGSKITINQLRNFGRKKPTLGVGISICMLSMAGFPSTAGFYGKCMIFKELLVQGHTILAVVGLISSFSLVYCCIRVLLVMFTNETPSCAKYEFEARPTVVSLFTSATVVVCALISCLELCLGQF